MHHRDEKHSCAHAEKHLVTHVVYEKTDVCLMDNLNDLLTVTVTIGNAGDSWDNDGRHLPEILQEKSYSLSGPLRPIPETQTVVYRHIPRVPPRRRSDGMRPLDNRKLVLRCCEAFQEFVHPIFGTLVWLFRLFAGLVNQFSRCTELKLALTGYIVVVVRNRKYSRLSLHVHMYLLQIWSMVTVTITYHCIFRTNIWILLLSQRVTTLLFSKKQFISNQDITNNKNNKNILHISYTQLSFNLIVFAILSMRTWSLVTSSCTRVEFFSNMIASVKPGNVVAP